MRDHGAIVQPATDIAKLTLQWELLDAREERTLAEIRVAKGKLLREARGAFPKSGPKARGWGELLAKWKTDDATARRYMALAGYIEEVDSAQSERDPIPTYAEAGIVKKKTEVVEPLLVAPPTDEQREASYRREVVASLPPDMDTRQVRTHEVVEGASEARVSLNRLREKNVHLTDVSTSPEDFMRAKQLFIDIANYCLGELADAGCLDGKEQRRQMTLLKGGIS